MNYEWKSLKKITTKQYAHVQRKGLWPKLKDWQMSIHLIICAKNIMVKVCMPLMTSYNALSGLVNQALAPCPNHVRGEGFDGYYANRRKGSTFWKLYMRKTLSTGTHTLSQEPQVNLAQKLWSHMPSGDHECLGRRTSEMFTMDWALVRSLLTKQRGKQRLGFSQYYASGQCPWASLLGTVPPNWAAAGGEWTSWWLQTLLLSTTPPGRNEDSRALAPPY